MAQVVQTKTEELAQQAGTLSDTAWGPPLGAKAAGDRGTTGGEDGAGATRLPRGLAFGDRLRR